jgi:hypothetical protein
VHGDADQGDRWPVSVRDLVKKTTVLVRTGRSYLA